MNTKLSARLLSILAILMLILTACGGGTNIQEEIIGQWEIRDETLGVAMIFSFKEDGALTIWMDDMPIDGTYTWMDDTTVQMTMTMGEQRQDITGKVKIDGDQLTITNELGETETLTRVE